MTLHKNYLGSLLRRRAGWLFLAIIVAVLSVRCSPAPASPTVTESAVSAIGSPGPTGQPLTPGASDRPGTSPTGAAIIDTVPAATATSAPDLRLPPEEWRDWPVVPEFSQHSRDIYALGLSLGNDPASFSKVGDCQGIRQVLLGMYDLPDRYALPAGYEYLQETIDHFQGSFNRDGMAVKGGFNAATVLSPLWADPDFCLAGETPLECEFRIHKPGIVIISLEVWFKGRTLDKYEGYMRQIIEYSLAHGVVPILATKADNIEGDHSLNLATARLAHEYDIPMWNFWRAVQHMPNHGIDPNRDGFHILMEAWSVRSFTALQSLDAAWRHVRDASPAGLPTLAPNPPTSTPGLEPTREPIPLGGDGAPLAAVELPGRLWLGMVKKAGGFFLADGAYQLDFPGKVFSGFLPSGYLLQSVSPDGERVLASASRRLDVFTRFAVFEDTFTDLFYPDGQTGAYWSSDGSEVVFLRAADSRTEIVIRETATGAKRVLSDLPASPISLIPSPAGSGYWWEAGTCTAFLLCTRDGIWSTDSVSGTSRDWPGIGQPSLWEGGSRFAYAPFPPASDLSITVAALDGSSARTLSIPGDHLVGFGWAPGGGRLAILTLMRSDYYGKAKGIRIFLVTPGTWRIEELPFYTGLNPAFAWSPDGNYLALTSTEQVAVGMYRINLFIDDVRTQKRIDLSQAAALTSTDFPSVGALFWR